MHSTKKENLTSNSSPNILKCYWLAARPKTWIASISPVVIGTSLTLFSWQTFLLTLLFALCIQIGTNFANDALDFLQGADSSLRKGPLRAVQSGWISAPQMLKAAAVMFGAALLFALPLMIQAGLWSFALALLCILFGVLYTGGPKPLGYLGLGELLVFIFFGPVAVCGTYFLQTGTLNWPVVWHSLPPALLSSAILVANNLRDEVSDRAANKRTLVVRFGSQFGLYEYRALVILAAIIPALLGLPWLSLFTLSFAVLLCSQPSLAKTSLLLWIYTLLFYARADS